LHLACHLGALDICGLLLRRSDIGVMCVSLDNTSALHYLVAPVVPPAQYTPVPGTPSDSRELLRVMKRLLALGADVNVSTIRGDTPLHRAAFRGNSVAVAYLIKKEAKIDAEDKLGETPLHYAVRGAHESVVRKLMEAGADCRKKGESGSPLEIAQREKYEEIERVLLELENVKINDNEKKDQQQVSDEEEEDEEDEDESEEAKEEEDEEENVNEEEKGEGYAEIKPENGIDEELLKNLKERERKMRKRKLKRESRFVTLVSGPTADVHVFFSKHFKLPYKCFQCNGIIWRSIRSNEKGYCCAVCGIRIHKRCRLEAMCTVCERKNSEKKK